MNLVFPRFMRSSKSLVLVLAVVFATSAAIAQGAQAAKFTAETYPAHIIATQLNAQGFSFRAGVRTVSCPNGTLVADLLTESLETVNFSPSYANCTSNPGGGPATVRTMGGYFKIKVGAAAGGGAFNATLEVECEAPGCMEVLIYQTAAKHMGNEPLCVYEIPSQAAVAGVVLTNQGAGAGRNVKVKFNATVSAKVLVGLPAVCGAAVGGAAVATVLTGELEAVAKNAGLNDGLDIG